MLTKRHEDSKKARVGRAFLVSWQIGKVNGVEMARLIR
jgi:hypothetical protein